jgi:hypothetical protein
MNTEIEKLIDLAIADGQITEKERLVIIKKATEFGADSDEVEMILDGKLHQQQAAKPKEKEKVGNINTCPSCQAPVESFQIKCSFCSLEFRNISAVKISQIISEKIADIENSTFEIHEKKEKKKSFIENIPIPNTKEDVFELLSVACSKGAHVNIDDPTYSAWRSKAKEVLIKIKLIYGSDPSVSEIISKYESQIKRATLLNYLIWSLMIVVAVILFSLIYYKMLFNG